jgi:hypothetical protein
MLSPLVTAALGGVPEQVLSREGVLILTLLIQQVKMMIINNLI